jgi:ABC-2 type transport system permease protein
MPAAVVLTFRNLFKNVRTPMLLIASVAQPLVWLVMFSQTFSKLADTPLLRDLGYRSYVAFLLPGMMVLAILFTALQSGLAMVSDIDSGMLDKLRVSPISRFSILLGRVLADAVTMLAQGSVVLVAGTLLGARVETGWLGTFGMLASVLLLGIVWASLANLIALWSRNAELTMVAGVFLALPALFLSSAFLPLRLQPEWVQTVARFNPASYVIDVGQSLTSIGNDWGQDVRMLVALAVAAVLLMPATVAAFRATTR